MTRLDQALRIGSLGTSLSDLGDLVTLHTSEPVRRPLRLTMIGSPREVTVPGYLAEDAMAIIGKLLSDHLTAELADAATIHVEGAE